VLSGTVGCQKPTGGIAKPPREADRAQVEAQQATGEVPSAQAVIYARKRVLNRNDIQWQIVWQAGGRPAGQRVVHETSPTNLVFCEMPRNFGYLPSPGGSWLCVWEPSGYRARDPTVPGRTTWRLVKVPQGEAFEIAESAQGVAYLPHWLDDRTLLLERGKDALTYELGKLRPSQRLPAAAGVSGDWTQRDVEVEQRSEPGAVATEWRRAYIDDHYRRQAECLRSAWPRLDQVLGLSAYLRPRQYPIPDTLDNMLLRPMGVAALWGFSATKRAWPSIAVSPDCQVVARAGVFVSGSTLRRSVTGRPEQANRMEARLDVYDLATTAHLYGARTPWPYTTTDDVAVLPGPRGQERWYTDLRWSRDARYLSFTWHEDSGKDDSVTILDSATWKETLHIPGGSNAFVVPMAR